MAKRILFVHGAGEGAFDEDRLLVDSLERSLGPGYRIDYPRMPEDAPDYPPWRAAFKRAIGDAPGPVIIVGHWGLTSRAFAAGFCVHRRGRFYPTLPI